MPYERFRRVDEEGNEYWFGREVQKLLSYQNWSSFVKIIHKAMDLMAYVKQPRVEHFKEISRHKRQSLSFYDFRLTRLATCLVILSSDRKKPVVAQMCLAGISELNKLDVIEPSWLKNSLSLATHLALGANIPNTNDLV